MKRSKVQAGRSAPLKPEGEKPLNAPAQRHHLNPLPRLVVPLAIAAVVAIAGWLWWQCARNPEIAFLTRHAPAEWIVYPVPPSSLPHTPVDLSAEFRCAFPLARAPGQATLSLRAFKRGAVILNGVPVELPGPAPNWKAPQTVEVGRHLHAGTNRISVTVSNAAGPPALWLWLRGDGVNLVSDESWESSYAGAAWRPARLAGKPMTGGAGNPLQGGETVLASLRTRWPTLLVFAVLSAAGVALGSWKRKQPRASGGPVWRRFGSDPALVALAVSIGFWVLLFVHNAGLLAPWIGFDAKPHRDYINYILERKALPLAHEGASMYHPPLYYLMAAGVLRILSLSPNELSGVVALRLLSLGIGMVHLWLVLRVLRLVFPKQAQLQAVGVLLAAFVPAHLYVSHYVTNETLAAMLVTATVYLCLRCLGEERPSVLRYAGAGLCLGAALLTKFTGLLVAPWAVGVLAWRLAAQRQRDARTWLRTLGVMLLACVAVCGWHYARVWMHFGRPIVGNWEPASGFYWWQDEGYRTIRHFIHFGAALVSPLFSGFHGFADGLYSTLWGDALCGGVSGLYFRPPWNYDLMAAGYVLALAPTLAIVLGAALALRKLAREPTAEWWLLAGLAFSFVPAFVQMMLAVPSYAQIKAFYGLAALGPLCVFGALGWGWLARRGKVVGFALSVVLGVWAMNSAASLWISSRSAVTQTSLGLELAYDQRHEQAVARFAAALQADPGHAKAHHLLAASLAKLGRTQEAVQAAEAAVQAVPDVPEYQMGAAELWWSQGQREKALQHARRAIELGPDYPAAYPRLAGWLTEMLRLDEAIQVCREGLRVTPASPELHLCLGTSLAVQIKLAGTASRTNAAASEIASPKDWMTTLDAKAEEAIRHHRAVLQMMPDEAGALSSLAWIHATYPNARLRNGPEAVRLAKRACQLKNFEQPLAVCSLAAAFAEAGQFSDAVAVAQRAQVAAERIGQKPVAAFAARLAESFRTGRPYREPALPEQPKAP